MRLHLSFLEKIEVVRPEGGFKREDFDAMAAFYREWTAEVLDFAITHHTPEQSEYVAKIIEIKERACPDGTWNSFFSSDTSEMRANMAKRPKGM